MIATIAWILVGSAFIGLFVIVFGWYLIKSARESVVPHTKRRERLNLVLHAAMAGAMFCCLPGALVLVIVGRTAGIAIILFGALIGAIHCAVFIIK